MRVVVQRVSRASVAIGGKVTGEIGNGIAVFVAISHSDNSDIMKWMSNKLMNLRIFPDDEGKMNKSVLDTCGGILLVSNFTLYGDAHKGLRPSFIKSAPPEISKPLYESMVLHLKDKYTINIASGEFGAMMNIELVNDGPVTIIIEKENEYQT
ncbi:MAG: D-tyrosyl-tRNA(Tyr) deacylase [Ignavibacteriae bacterium]|nr:D-tyrosyl-tRNA(Tyr) deacylase [Ignavibacteriota bacterium]